MTLGELLDTLNGIHGAISDPSDLLAAERTPIHLEGPDDTRLDIQVVAQDHPDGGYRLLICPKGT